jgi:hypothetical protein
MTMVLLKVDTLCMFRVQVGGLHKLALLQAAQLAAQQTQTALPMGPGLLTRSSSSRGSGVGGTSGGSSREHNTLPLEILLSAGAEAGMVKASTKVCRSSDWGVVAG